MYLYQGKELLFISLTLPLENLACWNIASRAGSQKNTFIKYHFFFKVNSILTQYIDGITKKHFQRML